MVRHFKTSNKEGKRYKVLTFGIQHWILMLLVSKQSRTLEGSQPVPEHLPAEYEAGKIVAVRALDDLQRLQLNLLFPFQSVPEYKLARFFHESTTSLINIDRFFKANVQPNTHGIHFRSGYTWRNKMREMIEQQGWIKGTVNFHLHQRCAFYYEDLEDTIQYLLQQRAYADHLVFEPIHEFDDKGNRI